MTLNQIVDQIKTFAENHQQIESCYVGHISEATINKENLYYRFMAEPNPSTVSDGRETFDFRIGVFGKVNISQNNQIKVLSDTRQILTDFVAYFKNNPQLATVGLILPVTFEDFTEWDQDGTSGYMADVSISQFQGLNYCGIPVEGAPIDYSNVKIVDQDGNVIAALYPGQTYTVTVLQNIIDTINNNQINIIENII